MVVENAEYVKIIDKDKNKMELGMGYKLIECINDFAYFQEWASDKLILSIDSETEGLNPREAYIRLLVISDSIDTWIFDTKEIIDISPIFPTLHHKTLVGHNLLFDMGFLWYEGLYPTMPLKDTMLMSQLVYAGLRDEKNKPLSHSLEACAQRELKITLDKTFQKSDWSGDLTQEQLQYAAQDAAILLPLYASLQRKIEFFKLQQVEEIEHRCLPAMVWMSCMGVPINYSKWENIANEEQCIADHLEADLDQVANEDIELEEGETMYE